jgi:hypothetical protein
MGVSLQIYRAAIGEINYFKISSVVYTHFVQGFLLVANLIPRLFPLVEQRPWSELVT